MQRASSKPSVVESDAFDGARVRFLFDGMPLAMTATVLLSGITTLILASVAPSGKLYGWYAVIVLVTFARTLQYLAFRRAVRSGQQIDWPLWRRRFLVGCTSVGVAWGCASLLLFPKQLVYQVFLSFVVAGTSAGAVTTLSSDRTAALSFVVPSIVPLALMLMLQGTTFGLAMGLMVVLYLVLVVAATHRSHVQLLQSVRSDLEATANRVALARSELERRVSDEKLQALFEHSPLGIALLDDRNQVQDANPALMKLLEFDHDDLKEPQSHPALRALAQLPIGDQALTSTGSLGAAEYELTRRDGGKVAVAVHGMRIEPAQGEIYRWAFIEHIDERKAAEKRMRKLGDRLTLATHAARLGVWEFDPNTGQFFWDARMHELVDSDPDATMDLFAVWRQRLHPGELKRAAQNRNMPQREGSRFENEYRIIHRNGEERMLRIAGMWVVDPDHGKLRATGVAWDESELKRVERLKSEFLATVSHELRTPLTSIRAALSLVAKGAATELPAQVRHLLSIADRNSERLTLLIDDLLDVEKIESGKLRVELSPQPLLPLLRQAIQAQSAHAHLHGVHLDLQPGGENVVALVDPGRFLQVMVNLLSNAAKFSAADTSVSVGVSVREGRARVTVTDRGPGIPEQLRARLFTKFSPGDSSDSRGRGGTGLGLAIAKALVEQMGGTIGFSSAPDAGTTFWFELPLTDAPAS